MTKPRRHHFLPQCYLKGFAVKREKAFQTNVYDARQRRQYRTNIINIAVESDFDRIEVPGHSPDAIELALSKFESELEPAIQAIVLEKSLDDFDAKSVLLNFMCLIALRNPRFRERMRSFKERLSKVILSTSLATPERWQTMVARAQDAGYLTGNKVAYEDALKFFEADACRIEVTTTHHTHNEFHAFDDLLKTFFARRWILLEAPDSSGGFITSDHPMCLIWSSKQRAMWPPGYGSRGTEALFPLSQSFALAGTFEGEDEHIVVRDRTVADFNGIIASKAEWHVYSRDMGFRFTSSDGAPRQKASKLLDDSIFRRPKAAARGDEAVDDA